MLAWLAVLGATAMIHLRRRQIRFAIVTLYVHLVVAAAMVSLAVAAPVKTRDRLLARRVVLPKSEMSLRELGDYAEGDGRHSFPVRVWVSYPESRGDLAIHWPASELTFKEFLAVIEHQAGLRHHFGSCGNGSTILFGGNCCFGVSFTAPDSSG
ncbi:MAG: hypothetical protein U0790_11825 [Isosphaeraceae bacterium]